MHIDGHPFHVEAKNEIRKGNEGLLISLMAPSEGKTDSKIIVAKYIAIDTAQNLKANNINYLDISGNCYIKTKDLLVHIIGQKVQCKQKTNQAKAFQETGIKLIFHLLSNPENLQAAYLDVLENLDKYVDANIYIELRNGLYDLSNIQKYIYT